MQYMTSYHAVHRQLSYGI